MREEQSAETKSSCRCLTPSPADEWVGMIWESMGSNHGNLNLPLSHRRDTTESGMNLRIMGIAGGGGNPTIQLAKIAGSLSQ